MRRAVAGLVVATAMAGLLGGCGYTTQASLDPKYRTIHVSAFYNDAKEYGLEAPLTNAVIRKFVADNRLEVVEAEDADLLLEGKILDYRLRGLTYDQNDDTTQYLVVVIAGVRCTDTAAGTVLWEEAQMAGETSFLVQTADRLGDPSRGNNEAFLPNVTGFASEEENRAATNALEQLASDIFYRTLEPW